MNTGSSNADTAAAREIYFQSELSKWADIADRKKWGYTATRHRIGWYSASELAGMLDDGWVIEHIYAFTPMLHELGVFVPL